MSMEILIKHYWYSIAAQQESELKQYFRDDACIRWHNTNELFDVTQFIKANCEYPGCWNCEVERFKQLENTIITVARVWTEDMSFHVTSFFEMQDNKIKTLDEYWGDDGDAPQWRKDKNIGRPISIRRTL